MLNRKRPLRTYERKTVNKPFTNTLPSPVMLIRKYNPVENDCLDKSEIYNDSLHYDPFETTFDRIAKGAIVPPIPYNTDHDCSWKGSSSDSEINNSSNVKLHNNTAFDLFTCNELDTLDSSHSYTSKLTHKSSKITRKCKRIQRNVSKVVISKGTGSKKAKVIPKDETQTGKMQEQKKHGNKQKKRKQSKKSNRMCNKKLSHAYSSNINNLENTIGKSDILCNDNNQHQYKNVLKIRNTSQTEFLKTNTSITTSKCTSNDQQNIKPCFVELDAGCVQNYVLNREKAMETKQNLLGNVKFLCTDIIDAKKDVSKEQNAISKSISMEYDIIKRCKHLSIKECFVALYDDNNRISKIEKRLNGSVDVKCKWNLPHLTLHNFPTYNTNSTELIPHDIRKNKEKLIKDSVVKLERLKVDEFGERTRCMISSTPINKRVKSYICSASFSPININIHDASYLQYDKSSISNVKKDISNIKLSDQNNSLLLIRPSSYDFNVNIEHLTPILSSSEETQTRDSNLRIKASSPSYSNDIHTLPTPKYDIKNDMAINSSPASLNVLSIADTSLSLFSDATHDYLSKNTEECKVQKTHFANTSNTCDEIARATNSLTDLYLKRMQTGNNSSTKDETVNSNKCSFLNESQDNVNNTALLARLQDSIRITERRTRYPKWRLNVQFNISRSLNNEIAESDSKLSQCDAIDEIHDDIQSETNTFECSTNVVKKVPDHVKSYDNANKQVEKSLFLKPGKYWARSLSILNLINDGSNLNKLSLGKGKKWRHSVRDILDMQKQGGFQSCLGKDEDDTDLSCKKFDTSDITSSFDDNKCKTFNLTNHARISKRISVRVVPNNTTNVECKIKDALFLEAFGIKSKKSPNLKLSHRKESQEDNQIIKGHSTAKDVVLQRCSQDSYLSFSYCFPDSYLESCRKIGEGVYGEVFLYENLDKKSVIKIIPIEGKMLVNGEPQKKFNEILSEIVIAKELDNLRINTKYRTNGFVQVRNIKCVMGKYPKKLVELWTTYDNKKTSDNDCPSMFDEDQLYIALELGDGGEDLEAFVFQTAEEACALFLQTAFALAVAEKALEFEHRDLHWGNILISRTEEPYVFYNLDGKEIKLLSKGVQVSIIDFTLSRMLYQGCCMYNDLALDPALFTAHGEYQFEIYRLMRDKIHNNWNRFEPYTNILWLHYTLDKMITAVRYKRKNLKVHKNAIIKLKEFKDIILSYDSVYDFATDSSVAHL